VGSSRSVRLAHANHLINREKTFLIETGFVQLRKKSRVLPIGSYCSRRYTSCLVFFSNGNLISVRNIASLAPHTHTNGPRDVGRSPLWGSEADFAAGLKRNLCDLVNDLQHSLLEQLGLSGTAIGPLQILVQYVKKQNTHTHKTAENIYCCGGAEESTGGDGDAAAAVAHVV
jgi:hypothetical protein